MKRLLFVLTAAVSIAVSQQQPVLVQRENSFSVVAGMGVNLVNAPEIVEYVNSTAAYGHTVDDFATAVEFFGGVEFPVSEEWGIKIEHTYLFNSYNFLMTTGATQELFYSVQAPSLLVQKVISGEGYFVKIAAGGGYHFSMASQKFSTFGTSADFSSTGFGMKADITGQTAFDQNFYGYIGGHLGWEFQGTLTQSGNALSSFGTKQIRYFFAGLRFGVTYYL